MEKMGGGGHLNMAGVQLECTLEEAMQQVRDTLVVCSRKENWNNESNFIGRCKVLR